MILKIGIPPLKTTVRGVYMNKHVKLCFIKSFVTIRLVLVVVSMNNT